MNGSGQRGNGLSARSVAGPRGGATPPVSSRSVPAPGAASAPRVAPRVKVPVVKSTPAPAARAPISEPDVPDVEQPAAPARTPRATKTPKTSRGTTPRRTTPRRSTPGGSTPGSTSTSRAVPESRLVYLSVTEAVRRSGASASSVRAWVRTGQVRTRSGAGARGDRLEVALADVEAVLARRPAEPLGRRAGEPDEQQETGETDATDEADGGEDPPVRRAPRRVRPTEVAETRQAPSARARPRADPRVRQAPADGPQDRHEEQQRSDDVREDAQLVPMQTVEAMERLSGELYLAGQRAARAEAVAELRERRLTDLQQEVDDLQREATALWEQNQELLRRVALAEAQVQARASVVPAVEQPRWKLRR